MQGLEGLVQLLITLVIIGVFAYAVHWVIQHYIPDPAKMPALVISGLIFLIVLLVIFLRWAGVAVKV